MASSGEEAEFTTNEQGIAVADTADAYDDVFVLGDEEACEGAGMETSLN